MFKIQQQSRYDGDFFFFAGGGVVWSRAAQAQTQCRRRRRRRRRRADNRPGAPSRCRAGGWGGATLGPDYRAVPRCSGGTSGAYQKSKYTVCRVVCVCRAEHTTRRYIYTTPHADLAAYSTLWRRLLCNRTSRVCAVL